MAIFGVILTFAGLNLVISKDKQAKDLPMFAKICVLLMGGLLTIAPFVHLL